MERNKVIKKSDAVKEAKSFYSSGGITEWTQKEFIEDYLEALKDDGYKLI